MAIIEHLFDNGAVLDTVTQLRTLARDCADTLLWSLSTTQLVECLDTLHTAEQALAAAKLHLITEIDARGVPAAQHGRSCAT